ncbi:hypothetical protein ACQEVB_26295 [Pseudonocardia sp. CA-107938]|uniref:hypothetical protein n=1 Tax=Pseudonocardia sp. CA-107938 TaxID=3240021 RepID=UPI003D8D8D02
MNHPTPGPGVPPPWAPGPAVHTRELPPTLQAPGPPPPGWPPPPPPHMPPVPVRRRRRKWPIITAIIAVLALGAGAAYAFNLFTKFGGASTSKEAVSLLAADLQSGSTLSALSRLHPGERTLLVDMQTTITGELKRLEIIRPDADLMAASATVSDLRFDDSAAEPVRDDVVITKLVAGKISVADDKSQQIFTDSFRKAAFPNGVSVAGMPTTIDIATEVPEGIRVATVRVDGRWYVSAFYTAADYFLRSTGTPWPKTSVPARGASSATDALRQTVTAALDGNVRRLVELAPPSELQVLHDVGDAIVAATGGEASGARLVDLQTTETSIPGGTALQVQKVVVENAGGETATVTRDGACIVVQAGSEGTEQRLCSFDDFGGGVSGPPVLDRVLPKLFAVVTNPRIVAVQDGGAFYVSPFRTVTTLYGDALHALDPQDVRDLLALAQG